ncbi:winged helix-turn-helix transcriptional regulator [Rhodococcus sp. NPDC058514]|uniref:winged helix-turn-helix transcriptional regulator n=1 Tax=unclassified Rhodococcus (in: high G+C Gram-positive bacteria) TaxID=192944 RepID=UPI0036583A42
MVSVPRAGTYVCGIDAAMDVIGGKWKVLILWELDQRDCRFGELRRRLPGVTEKVLASHLKELEHDGIVLRTDYGEVPPRVEYSLTPLGRSLNAALAPLGAWGREHVLGQAVRAVPLGAVDVTPPGPDADSSPEPARTRA